MHEVFSTSFFSLTTQGFRVRSCLSWSCTGLLSLWALFLMAETTQKKLTNTINLLDVYESHDKCWITWGHFIWGNVFKSL